MGPANPLLGDLDRHLLAEGRHPKAYARLGAHPGVRDGREGTGFAVWAPRARAVSVVGDFNGWNGDAHPLVPVGGGYWEGFVPGAVRGQAYKYRLVSELDRPVPLKSDPFAFRLEPAPGTASIIEGLPDFPWTDEAWLAGRSARQHPGAPLSIYEVHPGSWRRGVGGGMPTWGELARTLIPYALDLGFTHLQLLPVMEHPFLGSWGYQPLGLFAPTARLGTPADFAAFVDAAHQAGLGVILDWVPAHFPEDPHGLARFDGSCLYEHEDPRQGRHPDWGTLIYNYGRPEVRAFLNASACYWLDRFHVDGLRVDAVASMLYLDYSREAGAWIPNRHGGRENLEAVGFLRELNDTVAARHPGALRIAEESTAWPGVSAPVDQGGLGFGFKWDMGWMNDTLRYFHRPMQVRRAHQDELTFGLSYQGAERFVLPLGHDEVVHGKGSLLRKMPGTRWEQFANLRLLLAWMHAHGGKKLLFMGGELAQDREWDHQGELDWGLLEHAPHRGVQALVRDLNRLHRDWPALHAKDGEAEGFEWIDCGDRANSVLVVLRQGGAGDLPVVAVFNFTGQPREGYRIGVPRPGPWQELLNTDAAAYGGENIGNLGAPRPHRGPWHGQPHALELTLPPLAGLFLVPGAAD